MRPIYVHFLLLVLISILFVPTRIQAHESYSEQQIEVALRMIGHQVLLDAGDSTSRVLPIEKEEGRYRIQFDTDFQFEPEALVSTVNRVLQETDTGLGYHLAVEDCATGKVVYSFRMGNSNTPDIIPCKSRAQPLACYSLLLTLLDPVEHTPLSHSDTPESVAGVTTGTDQLTYPFIGLLLLLMGGVFIAVRKNRIQPPTKPNPNLIALGDYRFDKRNGALLLDQERIKLTGKEADLLMLLYDSANTAIERAVILNRVWGDEGAYVGRTLDVFVSKLRKKLSADPNVRIANIRGVGYKLVVDA